MLLARLAAAVGLLAPRRASQRWAASEAELSQQRLCIPVHSGPRSDAQGRAQLTNLLRAFAAPRCLQSCDGSPVLPLSPGAARAASKALVDASPSAHRALVRAASADSPTVPQLRASAALYSGPSGTGPNEAAHSTLNEVFRGLGNITVSLYQRLATIAWMRGVVAATEAVTSTGAPGVRATGAVLRSWHSSWAATLQHSLACGAGWDAAQHPLSSGPLFKALNGAQAPARYSLADAKAAGLQPQLCGTVHVSDTERTAISTTIEAVLAAGELPVSRRALLQHVAARVPGMVSTQQVLAVIQSQAALGELDED